jgi:hypothetical protein
MYFKFLYLERMYGMIFENETRGSLPESIMSH